MSPFVRPILLGLAGLMTISYVITGAVVAHRQQERPACGEVELRICDLSKRRYVTEKELNTWLYHECGKQTDRSIDSVSLLRIEEAMLRHPMIRHANAFATPDGRLCIRVEQRIPTLRVMADGDENYYVDSDRMRMPVTATTAAYLPILTGRVTERMATGELYDLALQLEDNPFWQAQIEQIHVRKPGYIELIPRIGSGTIILGDLTDTESKLRRLQKLYTDGFSKFGWNNAYREIDLRFRGQVVCRK